MEPSAELREVVSRFFEALRDADVEAVSNRISRHPGFERFGSDPDEVWDDGEAAARVWVQQVRELGGYPWRLIDEIRAMSEGTVGWACVRTEFDSNVGPIEYRFTCVLHLEHGEWRIVQWHGSNPIPNEEHGHFLTKSVDQIAEAVSESRPDLTGSSASDGTVTIAFTDIEDSTKLNALLGDRRWLDVLRVHNVVVTDITAEHGGTVVKGQGDGFMLAFASARRSLLRRRSSGDRRDVRRSRIAHPGSDRCARGETVHEATTSSVTRQLCGAVASSAWRRDRRLRAGARARRRRVPVRGRTRGGDEGRPRPPEGLSPRPRLVRCEPVVPRVVWARA